MSGFFIKTLSVLLICLFPLQTALAVNNVKPAHHVSPEFYTPLFENDVVLVLKMVLKPGEADKQHRHQDETVYFQQGGTLQITLENGESIVAEIPDGHVMWHESWVHQVTNIGETEVIAIVVEQKSDEKNHD